MTNFGLATIAATGFAAALLGLAAPAEATVVTPAAIEFSSGVDHHQWVNDIQRPVVTPPASVVGNGR